MSKRTGECRCGAVQFEVEGPPLLTIACHCTGCQRMTSSAYSLSESHAPDVLRVTKGETVLGGLRQETQHHFCPECMSWLFTRPAGGAPFVNVRATLFEDARSFVPFLEVYRDEGLPWASTGAELSFATAPDDEEWPSIIGAYQATGRQDA